MSDKELQVVSEQVAIETKNIEVVPYGLQFKNELSREEFGRAFNKLQHVNTMYQWYLGDLVAQADSQWRGEMYDLMMDITGLERDTLKHLSNVSRAFPIGVRERIYESVINSSADVGTLKLGWSHFQSVAPLMSKHVEQAVDFLIRAGQQGWTVANLRDQIARWKNGGNLPGKSERAEATIPDGWEKVKAGEFGGYVPAPIWVDEDTQEKEDSFLVQIYEEEAERLIDYIKGNSGFESLVERLATGLGGV